jgi:hypothetical protein
MNDETRKVLDKMKKLFALAGSSNEAEALSASEKAHVLLRDTENVGMLA